MLVHKPLYLENLAFLIIHILCIKIGMYKKIFHARSSQQQTATKRDQWHKGVPKHVFECLFTIKAMASGFLTTGSMRPKTWVVPILQSQDKTRAVPWNSTVGHDCTSKKVCIKLMFVDKNKTQVCKDKQLEMVDGFFFFFCCALQVTTTDTWEIFHIHSHHFWSCTFSTLVSFCCLMIWSEENFSSHTNLKMVYNYTLSNWMPIPFIGNTMNKCGSNLFNVIGFFQTPNTRSRLSIVYKILYVFCE